MLLFSIYTKCNDNLKSCYVLILYKCHVFISFCFSSQDYKNEPGRKTFEAILVEAIEATKPTVLPPPPEKTAEPANKPPYWDGDWVSRIVFTSIQISVSQVFLWVFSFVAAGVF